MSPHLKLKILFIASVLVTSLAAHSQQELNKVKPAVDAFPLTEVRLLDGPFRDAMLRDQHYMLELDSNRLLHNFRVNVGLPSTAIPLGGWEEPKCELRGHTIGHYLSALSLMYASTGEAQYKRRVDYIVGELATYQSNSPAAGFHAGYLSAFPESFIDRVEKGKKVWAPWYTLHKIMAGLLDAYQLCGNQHALVVLEKMADWAKLRMDGLTHEQMQNVLDVEHGGMNDVLAKLFAVTGNTNYLQLSEAFNHDKVLDPLKDGEDALGKLHANTQIPKVIGAVSQYTLTGDARFLKAANTFWDAVALHRSYVIGGDSDHEHFFSPDNFANHLSAETCETCNTYNMLKLTRELFALEPSAEKMDFYERGLYNHILASQDPETGMFAYYVSLEPGHFKSYSTRENSFWCCVGTGMENHAKYTDSIYFHAADSIYVNLFMGSELNWREKGIFIRQETRFPESDKTILKISLQKSAQFALKIRHPAWADGGVSVSINGKAESSDGTPGSYFTLERKWHNGDTVEIRLPMQLHLEPLPCSSNQVAILYGPIVLAGELGTNDLPNLYIGTEHVNSRLPVPSVPGFACDGKALLKHFSPVVGAPLTFFTQGVGQPQDVTLIPFYRMHHQRYSVYWKLASANQSSVLVNTNLVLYHAPDSAPTKEIARSELLDRIYGGWVGMLIGGIEGLAHEFKYTEKPRATLPDFAMLPNGARTDDDNDIELPHLFFMDKEGVLKLPYSRIVEIWKTNMNTGIWCANKRARQLMGEGVVPPQTGDPAKNKFAPFNLAGQFSVESYGMIAPGMPQAAAEIATHYAHIALSGEPIQAAQYWPTLISLAAVQPEAPLEKLMTEALKAVDTRSAQYQAVTEAIQQFHLHQDDWKTARQHFHDQWWFSFKDPVKMRPGKWNDNSTPLNGAMVILALLYGGGDFYRSCQYAMALGYDADCNAATVGAVLGVRLGFKKITALPNYHMPDIYTNATRLKLPRTMRVSEQAELITRVSERVIRENGGDPVTINGQPGYRIKLQEPKLLEPLHSEYKATIETGEQTPVAEKIACAISDRQDFQNPGATQLAGWIDSRISANESNRLVKLNPARLLEGYRHRPGRQSWDGEHVGKRLHAATLAWVNSGDPALREKLDYVAMELCHCQLDEGYLGTYTPDRRWTEWDVWAHKYNLIGLITYMRFTGNLAPMKTCTRMADLLCQTFGDEPGKRDIITSGSHKGMASTSVLEPMVLLYRMTGEERYLQFCNYILRSWEQPNGPHIISTLLKDKCVDKVGNGKAYEMLSCLNGALELFRTTDGTNLLQASLNAWQDIVSNRMYVNGAISYREHFHGDFDFPNTNNVGETCVTVTWLQFNAQLLRLTGEARFADQIEWTVYNHLFAAQRPDGTAWCYYTELEGTKPYSTNLNGHCCLSSGPRGIALLPTLAETTDAEGVVFNFYAPGCCRLKLRDGQLVALSTETAYPDDGAIRVKVESVGKEPFALKLRIPQWCKDYAVTINDQIYTAPTGNDGYLHLCRQWSSGDVVDLRLEMEPQTIVGDHQNDGKVAFRVGPVILAVDQFLLPADANNFKLLKVIGDSLIITKQGAKWSARPVSAWPHEVCYQVQVESKATGTGLEEKQTEKIFLIPYADAGANGNYYSIWLPCL